MNILSLSISGFFGQITVQIGLNNKEKKTLQTIFPKILRKISFEYLFFFS